jgi:hypothetical protein
MENNKEKASEIIGKAIIDLGKLIFAGLVIASIFNTNVNKYLLIIFGLLGCASFLLIGTYLIVKKTYKTNKK